MKRLHSGSYGHARTQISGAAQFLKGIAEHAPDPDQADEADAIYRALVRINARLHLAERDCRARELEYRLADPEGWELARSLGGKPIE